MSDLTLLILRVGFLLLLWLFIFAIVYALRSDLFGAPVRRLKGEAGGGSGSSGSPLVAPPVSAPSPATPIPSSPGPAAAPTQQVFSGASEHSGPAITPSAGALPTANGTGAATILAITSGVATGTTIVLDEDLVTIGRSGDSTLVIVDEYTSTYHARLTRTGDHWTLTDLDSTNGTRLNGDRVTKPVTVPLYTPVTIGTTTFELRP